MTEILLAGLAMMLVLEGVLPLLLPRIWRDTLKRVTAFNDGQLRFIGLASILAGLGLLLLVKN